MLNKIDDRNLNEPVDGEAGHHDSEVMNKSTWGVRWESKDV